MTANPSENHPPVHETQPDKARIYFSDIEFRGQTIYFIVLDRFCDGTESNTGEDQNLNDPTHQHWGKYWGGDLQGVYDKLDYLQGLGVTAIWVTPLFEQIEALSGESAPIHGYWTKDFKRINSRWVNDPSEVEFSKRDDTIFDKLIAELHRRGMKFILDIVCNHSSPASYEGKGQLYDDGKLVVDFDDDKDHWYHHYGDVTNWQDEWQVQNCELCGLATFNENNIQYRNYIKDAIKLWLKKGVDALRIDTVKHMPLWFWQEFTADMMSAKPDVFIFGEWIYNAPEIPQSVEFANKSGMTVLDFGLCTAMRTVLAEDNPAGFQVIQNVFDQDGVYRGATEMVTFFENHDMPRLQSMGANNDMLRIAVALILTARGTPCLFYGCEQYLHDPTNGGQDPYNRPMMSSWDTETPIYKLTKALGAERAKNPSIQWGGQWPKVVTKDVFVFLRRYRESRCLVVLNKGGDTVLENVESEFPAGEHTCLITGRKIEVKEGKIEKLEVAANEILVLSWIGEVVAGKCVIHLQLNGINTAPGETVAVIGDCAEFGHWDLRDAFKLEYVNSNTWFGEPVFEQSAGHSVAYKYVVFPAGEGAPRRENHTARRRPIAPEGVAKWRDIWEE